MLINDHRVFIMSDLINDFSDIFNNNSIPPEIFQKLRKDIHFGSLLLNAGYAPFCPALDYQYLLRGFRFENSYKYFDYLKEFIKMSDTIVLSFSSGEPVGLAANLINFAISSKCNIINQSNLGNLSYIPKIKKTSVEDSTSGISYVAGAYSDDNVIGILNNIKHGINNSIECLRLGKVPFCPWLDSAYQLQTHQDDDLRVQNSLRWLEVSGEVLVTPNWEHSNGTIAEIKRAKELGIPVHYSIGIPQKTRYQITYEYVK